MRWKWILGISAALILGAAVIVYIVLSSYDFNSLKPTITKAVRDATGRELTLGGDIDLKIGLIPVLAVEDVKFQNATWGSRPDLAKIKRFELQVRLLPLITGDIRIRRLVAIEPDILIETDKSGKSNLEFSPSRKTTETPTSEDEIPLPIVFFKEIRIEKGRITYNDGPTGRTYEVSLKSFTARSKGDPNGIVIKLSGIYRGTSFEMDGTTVLLDALADPRKAWPLKISLKTGDTVVTVDGTVKDILKGKGFDLALTAECPSISAMEKLSGVTALPDTGPVRISCRARDVSAEKFEISELKLFLVDSVMEGSLAIDLTRKRPLINAALTSEKLDLRPLLAGGGKDKGAGKKPATREKKEAKVFPDNPLPLEALNQFDASVKADVKKLLLPGLAFEDMNMDMVLEQGSLSIRPLNARMGGGKLDGQVFLDAGRKAPTASLTLKVTQLDFGRMMKDLQQGEILEGKLDLDVDLKGKGRTPASIMAALNGKTNLVMGDGKIDNAYIETFGADISSSIFRLLNPSKAKTEYTRINCFVGLFDIKDGIADTSALVMDTPLMVVAGHGVIDLKTEEIDLSLHPSPKEGVGGVSLSLGELAKPFKLKGTLASPSLGIDPTKAALAVGKAVGGVVLFGPLGLVSALASKSSEEKNPCLAAVEAAAKKGKPQGKKTSEKQKGIVEKTTDSIGDTFKKLFGK